MKSESILRNLTAVILVALALVAPAEIQARAPQSVNPSLVAYAERVTGDRFRVVTSTPRGVTVVGISMPRPEVLNAIDSGLGELFAIARRHGYQRHLNFTDYTVFIGRADRTTNSEGQYSPDIAVSAGQYAGSVYDKGGFIYAAGMVLTFNPSTFVIPENDRDMARISNVVRYEGEHLVLYYNDRALYARTADHSHGGSHPILQ